MAIVGGLVLSLGFLRQIDAIANAAEAIIAGDMRRRMPLRRGGDELDRLAATLNRMLDRITDLMETLHQVSNDIAHDLRTPLGRLRQNLEETRRSPRATVEYEQSIDQAIKESDEILETFGALLRIAQIESGMRTSGFVTVEISNLVEHVYETYRPVAEDAGMTLSMELQPGIRVEGDRELLAQFLVNLIENAIAHTGAGTKILLSLVHDGAFARLRVSDNGPGVPPSELENIFKRFYRLESSRTTSGSGLGLSLVDAIANLHLFRLRTAVDGPGLSITAEFKPLSGEAGVQ